MKERIGFIGLGNMGKPMAENLARAGFPMTVLDLDPEPVADLVALGATAAESARELAAASDVICSVVMNDRQTLDVLLDHDGEGVLAGAAPGSLIMIHSTVSLDTCQRVGAAAEAKGVQVLDAAVSGAAARSRSGTLTLMVGGDPAQVERAQPIFDIVGEHVYHMGALGMGQAAKVCNNLMCLVNVHVVEEALRLAREAGIDEATMREVAESSSGVSWSLSNIDALRELAGIHTGGHVDMSIFGRKDISLASKLVQRVGIPVPITDFVFDQTKK
jgi:3-hydroxyisobutyrate dehydrogenase-like beta-hydroxyacid dehydrogenase